MADHNRMEISHDVDEVSDTLSPASPSTTPTPTGHTAAAGATTTTTLTVAPGTAELATTNEAGYEVLRVPVLQGLCPACGHKLHHLVMVAANASVEVGNNSTPDNVITSSPV